jgi:hypothetical protein
MHLEELYSPEQLRSQGHQTTNINRGHRIKVLPSKVFEFQACIYPYKLCPPDSLKGQMEVIVTFKYLP